MLALIAPARLSCSLHSYFYNLSRPIVKISKQDANLQLSLECCTEVLLC